MPVGVYRFEIKAHALLEDAPDYRRSAPEATDALNAAVDAFKEELKRHGFLSVRTGYGSQRLRMPE